MSEEDNRLTPKYCKKCGTQQYSTIVCPICGNKSYTTFKQKKILGGREILDENPHDKYGND